MSEANLELARTYISLFNDPTTEPARYKVLLAPDVEYTEMPNQLAPKGSMRDRDAMLHGIVQGARLLREQQYVILNEFVDGDTVILEVDWRGTLAQNIGRISADTQLHARIAMFLEFEDGQIVRQRNYDAYDPF